MITSPEHTLPVKERITEVLSKQNTDNPYSSPQLMADLADTGYDVPFAATERVAVVIDDLLETERARYPLRFRVPGYETLCRIATARRLIDHSLAARDDVSAFTVAQYVDQIHPLRRALRRTTESDELMGDIERELWEDFAQQDGSINSINATEV